MDFDFNPDFKIKINKAIERYREISLKNFNSNNSLALNNNNSQYQNQYYYNNTCYNINNDKTLRISDNKIIYANSAHNSGNLNGFNLNLNNNSNNPTPLTSGAISNTINNNNSSGKNNNINNLNINNMSNNINSMNLNLSNQNSSNSINSLNYNNAYINSQGDFNNNINNQNLNNMNISQNVNNINMSNMNNMNNINYSNINNSSHLNAINNVRKNSGVSNNSNEENKAGGKFTCRFELQIENCKEFQVARRLIGAKVKIKNIQNFIIKVK